VNRPEAAQLFLCSACAREWIEVGPWAFGAVCKDPVGHKRDIRPLSSYSGATKQKAVMR
jgi:hypothetical protein